MARVYTQDRLYTWWTHAIKAPDQLRQRVAFALSDILVISDNNSELSRYPRGVTNYYDLLVWYTTTSDRKTRDRLLSPEDGDGG